MKTKTEKFEVLVPGIGEDEIAERVTVDISLRWDDDLEEWLLTEEAHRIIEDTKARHMGLLLPKQLMELRHRYGYSKKEMGELFQVGEKSWNRWESGKHRPSRSINLLIRALYEGEISVDYLLEQAGKERTGDVFVSGAASGWRDIGRLVSLALARTETHGEVSSREVFYNYGSRHRGWMMESTAGTRAPQPAALGARKVIRMDTYIGRLKSSPGPSEDRAKNITVG